MASVSRHVTDRSTKLAASMDEPIEPVDGEHDREWCVSSPPLADPLAVVLGALPHGGDCVQ
jgi:hypothetical protein